jgi:hypothetical protein
MEWRVENTTAAPHEFLRSSCIQATIPGAGPKGTMQDGSRDFSKNFVAPPPAGTFDPPAGVDCPFGGAPFTPASDCAPACGDGALCCQDPKASPPGTCYGVTSCSQLPGGAPGALGGGYLPTRLDALLG